MFPRWVRGDCVDLFWSPRHHLPLGLNSRVASVVTVHDLVWKRYPETMLGRNRLLEHLLMPIGNLPPDPRPRRRFGQEQA